MTLTINQKHRAIQFDKTPTGISITEVGGFTVGKDFVPNGQQRTTRIPVTSDELHILYAWIGYILSDTSTK